MEEPLQIFIESPEYIILKLSGDLSKERLAALKTAVVVGEGMIRDLSAKAGKKIKILLDMSEFSGTYSAEALEVMAVFAKDNRDYVEKTACFGGSGLTNMAGEMVAALSGRGNIRFFPNKEEATIWLGLQ